VAHSSVQDTRLRERSQLAAPPRRSRTPCAHAVPTRHPRRDTHRRLRTRGVARAGGNAPEGAPSLRRTEPCTPTPSLRRTEPCTPTPSPPVLTPHARAPRAPDARKGAVPTAQPNFAPTTFVRHRRAHACSLRPPSHVGAPQHAPAAPRVSGERRSHALPPGRHAACAYAARFNSALHARTQPRSGSAPAAAERRAPPPSRHTRVRRVLQLSVAPRAHAKKRLRPAASRTPRSATVPPPVQRCRRVHRPIARR
jgi:hypothetical protein